ncbi:Hypothetical_protein [Hexamita inflata]|uniref:Hypothetical_protein n=1 Tax=Hexamita inflata TaxID=28002 RepID=A0AA86PHJ8_9EUKA|nr:Hypothetical protein HINF_LOCUS26067 [Hexamita inflata]
MCQHISPYQIQTSSNFTSYIYLATLDFPLYTIVLSGSSNQVDSFNILRLILFCNIPQVINIFYQHSLQHWQLQDGEYFYFYRIYFCSFLQFVSSSSAVVVGYLHMLHVHDFKVSFQLSSTKFSIFQIFTFLKTAKNCMSEFWIQLCFQNRGPMREHNNTGHPDLVITATAELFSHSLIQSGGQSKGDSVKEGSEVVYLLFFDIMVHRVTQLQKIDIIFYLQLCIHLPLPNESTILNIFVQQIDEHQIKMISKMLNEFYQELNDV